jgi:hypothetical protein
MTSTITLLHIYEVGTLPGAEVLLTGPVVDSIPAEASAVWYLRISKGPGRPGERVLPLVVLHEYGQQGASEFIGIQVSQGFKNLVRDSVTDGILPEVYKDRLLEFQPEAKRLIMAQLNSAT